MSIFFFFLSAQQLQKWFLSDRTVDFPVRACANALFLSIQLLRSNFKTYLHKTNLYLNEVKTNLEHPDLPQGDLFDDGIVFGLHEFLDGDDLARVSVPALEHNTVGSLADLPDLLILLHLRGSFRWVDGQPGGGGVNTELQKLLILPLTSGTRGSHS